MRNADYTGDDITFLAAANSTHGGPSLQTEVVHIHLIDLTSLHCFQKIHTPSRMNHLVIHRRAGGSVI